MNSLSLKGEFTLPELRRPTPARTSQTSCTTTWRASRTGRECCSVALVRRSSTRGRPGAQGRTLFPAAALRCRQNHREGKALSSIAGVEGIESLLSLPAQPPLPKAHGHGSAFTAATTTTTTIIIINIIITITITISNAAAAAAAALPSTV